MKLSVFKFIVVLLVSGFSLISYAAGGSQVTISSPSTGSSYSATANVSASVSWSNLPDPGSNYYVLDRRVFGGSVHHSPSTNDTCYFTPVVLRSGSGNQSGTMYDGNSVVSTTASSSNCFPYSGGGANGVTYDFVTTIVYCSGTSYTSASSCVDNASKIVARSTRQFYHRY